uniref:Putative secreted protein n=1 Tax=Anopheles marajoara TaxID=58244 RepID=A0A2M4CBT7_9DIPT
MGFRGLEGRAWLVFGGLAFVFHFCDCSFCETATCLRAFVRPFVPSAARAMELLIRFGVVVGDGMCKRQRPPWVKRHSRAR